MEAKPKMAFVGRPSEVEIDSGSAKNARYASEFPSMRNSSRGGSPSAAAMVSMLEVGAAALGPRRPPLDRYAGRRGSEEQDAFGALPARAPPREPTLLRRAPPRASQRSTT